MQISILIIQLNGKIQIWGETWAATSTTNTVVSEVVVYLTLTVKSHLLPKKVKKVKNSSLIFNQKKKKNGEWNVKTHQIRRLPDNSLENATVIRCACNMYIFAVFERGEHMLPLHLDICARQWKTTVWREIRSPEHMASETSPNQL